MDIIIPITLGKAFLQQFNNSLSKVLQSLFPKYPWLISDQRLPPGYWNDPFHVDSFIKWVAEELNIGRLDEWYRIPVYQITNMGGKQANRNLTLLLISISLYLSILLYIYLY